MEPEVKMVPTSHVPTEVWAMIADSMCTREWARASGTCKAAWAVTDLRHIESHRSTPSELKWLSKRWASTQMLCLMTATPLEKWNIEQSINSLQDEDLAGLQNLRKLDVHCTRDPPHSGPLSSPWLERLLSHTAKLRALSLEGPCFPRVPLPAAASIKHLIMVCCSPQTNWSGLQGLLVLETLQIVGRSCTEFVTFNNKLKLTGCARLRAVCISKVPIEAVDLPAGCALTYRASGWTMMDKSWEGPEVNTEQARVFEQCTSCTLHSWVHEVGPPRNPRLLSHPLSKLVRLRLYRSLKEVMKPEPLIISGALPSLEELHMSSQIISVKVESALRLRTLVLASEGDLHFAVDHANEMAESLEAVRLIWKGALSGAFDSALHSLLGQKGGLVMTEEKGGQTTMTWLKDGAHTRQLGWMRPCSCHACLECLCREGHLL